MKGKRKEGKVKGGGNEISQTLEMIISSKISGKGTTSNKSNGVCFLFSGWPIM